MAATLLGSLVTALLSVLSKLATQSFFEAILTKVIIYAGEKLAPMTTNTLDDELVVEMKKRLLADKGV